MARVFTEHIQERDFWSEVAATMQVELDATIRRLRIAGKVEARAKTTGSVIGKAHRKPADYSELKNFGDLAGARITVPFEHNVEPIVEELQSDPRLLIVEDDTKVAGPTDLTYQARHLQLQLSGPIVPPRPESVGPERSIECELPIQTFAQNLWANTSHLITYKRELPPSVERRVNRLIALCEIFDNEAASARELALGSADDVEIIAAELQRYFHAITGAEPNPDQAVALVGALIEALDPAERADYPSVLEKFVTSHSARIADLLTDRPESRGIPLLLRPEAVLIFERLENAPARLRLAWQQLFTERDLDDLEAVWGPSL